MTQHRPDPAGPHPLLALARAAVEAWVRERRVVAVPDEPALAPFRPGGGRGGGVFVALKLFGELRGLAGTPRAADGDLAAEVARQAVRAASEDPHLTPVTPAELPLLSYGVDLLGEPVPLVRPADLDPLRDALLIDHDGRQTLVPPGLDGITTAAQQLALGLALAELSADQPYQGYRLPADHLAEPEFDRPRPLQDDDDEPETE